MGPSNETNQEVRGDDNLYGIGVRVGFYLQWAALLFAYDSVPSKFRSMLATIAIFQLALLITLVWKTMNSNAKNPLYELEAFLTLIYGVGAGFGSMSYALAQNSERLHTRRIDELYANFITFAFTTYALWFWFAGIQQLAQLPHTAYVFFFSKVTLHGWFIVFNQVITAITALISAVALLVRVLAICANWKNLIQWLSKSDTRNGPRHIETHAGRLIILCGLIAAFAMLVAIVELTIEWNMLVGVNDLQNTGQLIPLIIGIVGLVQMLVYWKMEVSSNS